MSSNRYKYGKDEEFKDTILDTFHDLFVPKETVLEMLNNKVDPNFNWLDWKEAINVSQKRTIDKINENNDDNISKFQD